MENTEKLNFEKLSEVEMKRMKYLLECMDVIGSQALRRTLNRSPENGNDFDFFLFIHLISVKS